MRPTYHYAAQANWLSDPNGLIHHDGEWHLFYQYNPHGEDWGHMSWGHAISRDLAEWEELPVAIEEDAHHAIFSGSAVVDPDNTAGFGAGALIAIYTGAAQQEPLIQSQCLAYSTDRGRSWRKYAGNPVLDLGMADFRDPNVFWHQASQQWVMVVVRSNEQCAVLYGSGDLKNWAELSRIETSGAPGEIWECPLLIELPVEGTDQRRWLFKVDVLRGAPGSGALYQTGTFDGACFIPDSDGDWQVADMGSDFYAAIAWHDPRDAQGRPCWIGWLGNHAVQGKLPKQGWRGAMSVPRRLSLRQAGTTYQLVQEIEPVIAQRVATVQLAATRQPSACKIALPPVSEFELVLTDGADRQLRIKRRGIDLFVSRRDPVSPFLDTFQHVHVRSANGLTLWLDCGSLELIGESGTLALSLQHRMAGDTYSAKFLLGTPG